VSRGGSGRKVERTMQRYGRLQMRDREMKGGREDGREKRQKGEKPNTYWMELENG
jgi:hypothetical protein